MEYRSQRIAYWYFTVALLLFVLQVIMGLWLISNYVFTILQAIVDVFPFATARAMHTNLLVLWMLLGFSIIFFILWKFAFPAILKGLKEREQGIQDALDAAKKAREEMAGLKAENERVLLEARNERDRILKEARETKDQIVNEARGKAQAEADRLIRREYRAGWTL